MGESVRFDHRLEATPALPPGSVALCDGATLHALDRRAVVRLQVSRSAIPTAMAVRVGATPLPCVPGCCSGDDPAVLWLAPDGWLLVSDTQDADALMALSRQATSGRTAAVVDVSDALVALVLQGPRIRDVLARSTGLELGGEALAPGRCTRTRFAQLPVILRPRAADRVELILDRAPAQWLWDWLVDAGSLIG